MKDQALNLEEWYKNLIQYQRLIQIKILNKKFNSYNDYNIPIQLLSATLNWTSIDQIPLSNTLESEMMLFLIDFLIIFLWYSSIDIKSISSESWLRILIGKFILKFDNFSFIFISSSF